MGIHDDHRARMRRKYLEGGPERMEDHELLEMLLYYAIPRQDTNETAHRLMERFGTLNGVLHASRNDLMQVPGIGENAAFLLKLAPAVCSRARRNADGKDIILNSSTKAGNYLLELYENETVEVLYELCLDRKGKLLACRRIGEGGVANVSVNLRKLVEVALLTTASGVIVCHNHPSGIALPSKEDYAVTDEMMRALDTIGVQMLDHIIVADGDFVSMADSGMMHRI